MAPQAPAPNAGPPAPDPPPIPGPLCRFVLDDVLPEADCRELIYAHRCAGVPGHVPGLSATLPQDLVAAGAEGLLVPLLRARQRVREALEAALGLHWALHFEFTALMGWAPGAFLGDHYDRNRPYLLHYSAVLYLNTGNGQHFAGGAFGFRDPIDPAALCNAAGGEALVQPLAGRLLFFSAGPENVHYVSPVQWGDRYCLTLWFTLDPRHDADPKTVALIRQLLHDRRGPPPAAVAGEERPRGAARGRDCAADPTAGADLRGPVVEPSADAQMSPSSTPVLHRSTDPGSEATHCPGGCPGGAPNSDAPAPDSAPQDARRPVDADAAGAVCAGPWDRRLLAHALAVVLRRGACAAACDGVPLALPFATAGAVVQFAEFCQWRCGRPLPELVRGPGTDLRALHGAWVQHAAEGRRAFAVASAAWTEDVGGLYA